MKKRSFFSRLGKKAKGYTYKLVGMNMIKATTAYIGDMVSSLWQSTKSEGNERSFDEAIERFGLTEEKLKKKKHNLLINGTLFLLAGLSVFFYACIFVGVTQFVLFINYLLVAVVLFAFAARMHFYRYLILQQRLDLNYKDWLQSIIKGDI